MQKKSKPEAKKTVEVKPIIKIAAKPGVVKTVPKPVASKTIVSKPVMDVKSLAKGAVKDDSGDYFVSIKRPIEVRRQLLEASKKSVYCLQNYYRLTMIREKKLRELSKARHSFRELMYLNKTFNSKLPKYLHKEDLTVRVATDDVMDGKKSHKKPKHEARKPVKEKTDLDRLEDSLRSIENRLRTIN